MQTPWHWLRTAGSHPARRPSVALWGVAPTGNPHFGYALPLLILKAWRASGTKVIPLVANWHGYLDSEKTPWADLDRRTDAYTTWLQSAGFPEVAHTSDFYTHSDYVELLFQASRFMILSDALDAGNSTLSQSDTMASISELLYMATQIIDIKYLDVDIALCGEDEARIYEYGLPLLSQHFQHFSTGAFFPLAPGLTEKEMHASSPSENRLDFVDPDETLFRKIQVHVHRSQQETESSLACFLFGPIADLVDLARDKRLYDEAKPDPEKMTGALVNAVRRVFDKVNQRY